MPHWTTEDIGYLEDHAHEGAEAVACALERSVGSVKQQAHRFGVSLRKRWECPRCGHESYQPLSTKTGWCAQCTKDARCDEIERQIAAMRLQKERDVRVNRRRQALYSRRSRLVMPPAD